MSIQIDEKYLDQIKTALGYPDATDLHLTDDQIKTICIEPALRDYFGKFPIKAFYQADMQEEVIIPFPDDFTFGVINARVTDVGMMGGTGSAFWDVVFFNQYSGSTSMRNSAGAYGIKGYNPNGALQTRDLTRQASKSYQNQWNTVKFQIDNQNKKLHAYSTISGRLNLTWAKYSENFADIKFTYINDVINLCQANLIESFLSLNNMISDTSLETTLNADALKETMESKRTGVKDKWNEIPTVSVMHFYG